MTDEFVCADCDGRDFPPLKHCPSGRRRLQSSLWVPFARRLRTWLTLMLRLGLPRELVPWFDRVIQGRLRLYRATIHPQTRSRRQMACGRPTCLFQPF
jgi:hypothetical protein